jgi:hypothetical protein
VSFFLWTAVLGKVLTTDNLCERRLILLDWCCMCKRDGESIDHLFLHCPLARELWDLSFSMFGVDWVMLSSVLGLLTCWPQLSKRATGTIWCMIPHCIMWSLRRERNACNFEGCEKNIHDLKKLFLYTLMEWTATVGIISSSYMIDFVDLCSFTL